MARITVQMGHVPRTRGATGTRDEQKFTRTVGPMLRDALAKRGHSVRLIGADDYIPNGDVFISLHCDGTSRKSRRGASIGFPAGYNGALGKAWKRWHAHHGYPSYFLGDNYTIGLRRYYSWPHRPRGATRGKGYRHWHLAEHGTTTNDQDHAWLFSHLDNCVAAHVDAIGEVIGHPRDIPTDQPEPEPEDETMKEGDSGRNVYALKVAMKRLVKDRKPPPVLRDLEVNYEFDGDTRDAVLTLKKMIGQPLDERFPHQWGEADPIFCGYVAALLARRELPDFPHEGWADADQQ